MEKRELITIYGDYDVDGVTAAALMVRVIEELGGAELSTTFPRRAEEGYGLHKEALSEIREAEQAGGYC